MNFLHAIWGPLREHYDARFEPEGMRELADIWWRFLLILAAIATLVALLGGISTLMSVLGAISESPGPTTPPPPALSRSQLQQVLDALSARAAAYDGAASTEAVPEPR